MGCVVCLFVIHSFKKLHTTHNTKINIPGGGVGDADAPVLGDPGGGRPAVEVVKAFFFKFFGLIWVWWKQGLLVKVCLLGCERWTGRSKPLFFLCVNEIELNDFVVCFHGFIGCYVEKKRKKDK